MKRVRGLLAVIIVIILSLYNNNVFSVSASVSSQNYKTVYISNEDIVIKNCAILGGSYEGDNFWVGDTLSRYSTICLVGIGELDWGIQAIWENPSYVIKEGYQEINFTLPYPANATVTLGITGVKNVTTSVNNPIITPSPTVQPEVTSTIDTSQEQQQDISPTLAKSSVSISPNVKYKIKVVDLPDGYTYSFTSNNKEVATVGAKTGVVKGIAKGKTAIKCIITTPDNQKITLKCVIVVK